MIRAAFRFPFVLALPLALPCVLQACGTSKPEDPPASVSDAGTNGGALDAGPALADCTMDCPAATALGTAVLGNPTNTSVALSLMTEADLEIIVEYGPSAEAFPRRTELALAKAKTPVVFALNGLAPNAAHRYRLRYRTPGTTGFASGDVRTFTTQRAPGATFTFTVQSDSHRDENSDMDLYRVALGNIRADHADFHVDLGDTFMTEKFATTEAQVVARYQEERAYFGLIANEIPLLLVNGNHEGEQGWLLNGTAQNVAVWATKARLAHYPSPLPDGFYTGNDASYPFVGKRGGYFSWVWGDALFIALDPYWFTTTKPGKQGTDGWTWTLGEQQYRWLEQTLQNRAAKYVFVFSHHMIGGLKDGRGGTEAIDLWEWGGKNTAGVNEFATKRPGWSKPIGQLLADANVSAWFHGHDHLYVKQDAGRTVYQEVPQPSHRGENGQQTATQWGYTNGKVLSSSGHMRVRVSPAEAKVEYVKAYLPSDETTTLENAMVGDSYTLLPR